MTIGIEHANDYMIRFWFPDSIPWFLIPWFDSIRTEISDSQVPTYNSTSTQLYSTVIWLQFDRAMTHEGLRYDPRPACVWAAALRPKYINRSAWLRLAGQRPVMCYVTAVASIHLKVWGSDSEPQCRRLSIGPDSELVTCAQGLTYVNAENFLTVNSSSQMRAMYI